MRGVYYVEVLCSMAVRSCNPGSHFTNDKDGIRNEFRCAHHDFFFSFPLHVCALSKLLLETIKVLFVLFVLCRARIYGIDRESKT